MMMNNYEIYYIMFETTSDTLQFWLALTGVIYSWIILIIFLA